MRKDVGVVLLSVENGQLQLSEDFFSSFRAAREWMFERIKVQSNVYGGYLCHYSLRTSPYYLQGKAYTVNYLEKMGWDNPNDIDLDTVVLVTNEGFIVEMPEDSQILKF